MKFNGKKKYYQMIRLDGEISDTDNMFRVLSGENVASFHIQLSIGASILRDDRVNIRTILCNSKELIIDCVEN